MMRAAPQSVARHVVLLAGFALVVLTASGFSRQGSGFRRTPPFEGGPIPDPPRQREPWQPPATTLPRFLVDASGILFEQGLADPRSCDFRAIEIVIGGVWSGGGGAMATHGWVLPVSGGEGTRFAVAWNGLVYPTVSIGEPADPVADVKVIADQAREARARGPDSWGGGFGGFGSNSESSSVSPTSPHAVKVCLLLRIGRADLAETVWAAGTDRAAVAARAEVATKPNLSGHGISYASLANDLAWYLFDRAVCAHMRGDDAIALADARRLTSLRAAVEAKAEAIGLDRPRRLVDRGEVPAPYIDFLGQLPELLADHERRAREPKRPPMPPPGADRRERIAALIAGLDQVAARQFGQPGGVSLGQSPIVRALVEEGDDAVGPLIEDLERDTRLTRSVHFFRDFHRSRTIMGAHEAAYTALCGILKTSFFGAASTGDNLSARGPAGRKAVADRVRAYWEKNRGVPLAERWFRTLADDQAGPGQWLQAASNIAQHENVRVVPGSTAFTSTVTTPLPPGARPRLLGEALREKHDPSVADLMARRVDEIDPGGPIDANSSDQFQVGSANQMASMLAEWDIKAALPVLKARVGRCARVVQAGQEAGRRAHGMEVAIANLTELRTKAGDPEALVDYAAWARTVTPDHFDFSPTLMFEPLWRNPDHPAVIAAAVALFEDPNSPWNPSIQPRNREADRGFRMDLLGSSLLGLKPFRALVLRALADKTQVGTVEAGPEGRVTVIQGGSKTVSNDNSTTVSVGSSGGLPGRAENPFQSGPSAMPLRVADLASEKLQYLEGIPRFQKQWPLTRRDQAIAACMAYLERYGERFRENEASRAIQASEPGGPRHEKPVLAFDPLDHPATAADVAAGRAIFSLDGERGEVRRSPLPSLPTDARWTRLEVFPNDPPIVRSYDAEGNEHKNTQLLQEGRVWQAEEVREGDRRRRYYGFVGRHALTRVAAEEVEFLTPWQQGWSLLSTSLDGRIIIKEAATTGPLPVEFSLRNHRGVESTAPTDLAREADGAPSIRDGISFRLVRESDKLESPDPFAGGEGAREKPFAPEEIPALDLRRHPTGASPRTLEPAGTVVAFRLDLRALFPIDRPGRYRLEITLDDLKTSDGTPGKVSAVFPVVPRKTE